MKRKKIDVCFLCLLLVCALLFSLTSCGEPAPQTLQPFADAEIVKIEYYKGPAWRISIEGEDFEALKTLLQELVVETAEQPNDLMNGFTQYMVTLSDDTQISIVHSGHSDKIWIDETYYTGDFTALIEKMDEISEPLFQAGPPSAQ